MTSLTFTGERGELEEYRVLQNGLTVLLAPTAPAAAVLVMVTYHAGSGDEGADAEGCSHMLEHMMFKGSARYNRSLGTSIHDKIGAVGGSTNATTWRDYTNYWCFVPSRHLELAIDIEADRMQAPLLARSDLDVERKVVLNEQDIRASSPMEFISDVIWRTMYPNHAYGRPVIGSRSAISNLSRDQLLHHHKSFYQTNNATITVAGHFDREEAKDQIGLLFGGIPPADPASRSAATPIASIRAHETTVYQQGAPECLAVVFPSPPGLHRDSDALAILALILASGNASRLNRALVATGRATHVWAMTSRLRLNGLFEIHVVLARQDDCAGVSRHIQEAILDIQGHGVSSEELETAKANARGQLITSRDGPLAVAMQINNAIAMGNWHYYCDAVERIEAVSNDDIRRAAETWLVDRHHQKVRLTGLKEGSGVAS